jgi:hypothetical protein
VTGVWVAGLVEELISEGAAADHLRDDVPAGDLAAYCLHALTAAASMKGGDAVRRLVQVTMSGLCHPA